MRLVLASGSPRRRELLGGLGLPFEVVPSAVEESLSGDRPATALTRDLALAKARDVAGRIHSPGGDSVVVLGADTLVVLDGRSLGKPASLNDARAMLAALSGRSHAVVTAVALVEVPGGREVTETVGSRVTMRRYSAAEIDAYLRSGEPYDKAGAYAIQGEGSRFVRRVTGCYTNVVGLPLTTTARLLRRFGFPAIEPALPRVKDRPGPGG